MHQLPTNFRTARRQRYRPLMFSDVLTSQQRWFFGAEDSLEIERGVRSFLLWDGSQTVGGGVYFNEIPHSAWGARVLSFGKVPRQLTSKTRDLFTSLSETRVASVRVAYNNRDHYFTDLFSIANGTTWLNAQNTLYLGYPTLEHKEFIKVFTGRITEIVLTDTDLTTVVEAV